MSLGDPGTLRRDQYKDSSNLNARGALHERFSTNPHGWFRWVHDHVHVHVIIANHMLYHVPDLSKALSEIRRVLRRGGRLYAATNGRSHLTEIADLIEAFDPALLPFWAKDRRTFDLDGGAEHLARWFADIRLYRYEDSLLVDEAEPLAAYVFSMPLAATQRARRASFARFVERRLAESGPLRITKDAGLFVAVGA